VSSSPALVSHKVGFAWKSHRGNFRGNNEDAVLVRTLGPVTTDATSAEAPAEGRGEADTAGDGLVAVICDGVGGGAAGEIASSIASGTFFEQVRGMAPGLGETAEDAAVQACLLTAVRETHAAILRRVTEDRALEGMGTTLTAAWLRGTRMHLAQIGDSRLYRLREGELLQLSQDQSLVGGLRRKGAITEAEARHHPLRNIIDQALGGSLKEVVPEIAHFELQPGDEILVCSDGLTDALPDSTLRFVLKQHAKAPVDEAAKGLLQAALDSAGRDNVSLILLRVEAARGGLSWSAMFPWFGRKRGDS
jgi:serine/threonine protein phosphatase PrpC